MSKSHTRHVRNATGLLLALATAVTLQGCVVLTFDGDAFERVPTQDVIAAIEPHEPTNNRRLK